MKLGRLNHVGVATPSIEKSIELYRTMFAARRTDDAEIRLKGGNCFEIDRVRCVARQGINRRRIIVDGADPDELLACSGREDHFREARGEGDHAHGNGVEFDGPAEIIH